MHHSPPAETITPVRDTEHRRVAAATIIGTAIEWYDYFLYAMAAALVFRQLMFSGLSSGASTIVAFLTVGISFLFRPLGAFLAGHYGDKIGRRKVLMLTLIVMGTATALIGLLPTYETIGAASPILLITLRIIQGISAGGEWGGAVLMAVEHAPAHQRGIYGACPQIGVPAGLLLASGVLAVMSQIAPGDAFLAWGWRVPFLLSFLLIAVGAWIRHSVEESPVFVEMAELAETESAPVKTLFRNHFPLVVVAALIFAGNSAVGYMTTGGYIQGYATDPEGPVGLSRDDVLWAVTGSAVTWLIFTLFAGWLSDRIGRRTSYIIGFILQFLGVLVVFPLVNTANVGLFFLGIGFLTLGLGLTYGQQAALYAEIFPASIRFSGVSISYAIGAIVGGAFAPMIAAWLFQTTGTTTAVTVYLGGMTLIGLAAVLSLRDRSGIPLGPEHEAEQNVSPIRWLSRT
ncbi:MFS transporter [Corynebacterium pygosceleis]|uniref:MFS transporter n=1 Tax=Corynebacterium pygosceleis TaxID=2800406 RepID=A0A9Q4CAS4_9CORY|nr:MFS transporter [Corynebacterium pygosceleis]MCK7636473.1 MHS family MFS transporter [Corynebacterium pygosceleis]MCK7675047.1 MHS family MFS transporter [Corynebacterium pygosceleis]MCL0121458.1 MHS family MFS transporter [Corynebacterium pygosceleis]MCX7445545.1 MFS transporter [Corynebacterium pygosceleis]MCX7469213.1 MFS transporter [Corynebacterium pygosceleis]